jgi:hypothetical protein
MIGLCQVDGKYPNLALMKLSAWYKARGEAVTRLPLQFNDCRKVYLAKVFQFSVHRYTWSSEVVRGGTGWPDWKDLDDLPAGAEHMYPDYDEFNCKYAMGYLSRGCIRKCGFCFVPEKEGRIRHHSDLPEWWHGQKFIRLLDANVTGAMAFNWYIDQLARSGAYVDFSQGVDARLIDEQHAEKLSHVKLWGLLHTAWDNPRDEAAVLTGIRHLIKYFEPTHKISVFVLVGYDTDPDEDLMRVEKLRELRVNPFVMPFNKLDPYQRHFARWVNDKAIFKSVRWADYKINFKGGSYGTSANRDIRTDQTGCYSLLPGE